MWYLIASNPYLCPLSYFNSQIDVGGFWWLHFVYFVVAIFDQVHDLDSEFQLSKHHDLISSCVTSCYN